MISDVTETISVAKVYHAPVLFNSTVSTKENMDVLFKLKAVDGVKLISITIAGHQENFVSHIQMAEFVSRMVHRIH
jgi:hypothetical protein